MARSAPIGLLVVFALSLVTSCATASSPRSEAIDAKPDAVSARPPGQRATITIGIRADLNAPATDLDMGGSKSNPSRFAHEFLNAYFVVRDHSDEIQPLLGERL